MGSRLHIPYDQAVKMARFRTSRIDGSEVLAASSKLIQRQSDQPVSPNQGDGNNGQGNQAPASGNGVNDTIIVSRKPP